MSPEQMQYQPPTFKSDVWSLGIVLYEMSTLELPFSGKNLNEIMEKVIKKPYKPLPDHYSNDLKELVKILLCKKEALRLTVKEVLKVPFVREYANKLKR